MSGDFGGFKSREDYYQAYDAAVLTLPVELRSLASLHSVTYEKGVWKFTHDGVDIGEHVESWRQKADEQLRTKQLRARDEKWCGLYPKQLEQISNVIAARHVKPLENVLADVIGPVLAQVDKLSSEKAIDSEVIDELANTMERVDALESGGGKKEKGFLGFGASEDIDSRMDAAVARYFAAHPQPQVRGVQTALINQAGALVITMTDGTVETLGKVVGRDGFSVESRELEYIPESHEIVETWNAGALKKTFKYPAGGIHHGGYWRQGMEVRASQTVTHDGSLWIAKRTTHSKPCHENKEDWLLAARKGRDAKQCPHTDEHPK